LGSDSWSPTGSAGSAGFGVQRIEPLGVSYKELVADMVGTTRRVLAFLGIVPPQDVQIAASTASQADALNQQ
jgi:LPS sulfotransferase NodH